MQKKHLAKPTHFQNNSLRISLLLDLKKNICKITRTDNISNDKIKNKNLSSKRKSKSKITSLTTSRDHSQGN